MGSMLASSYGSWSLHGFVRFYETSGDENAGIRRPGQTVDRFQSVNSADRRSVCTIDYENRIGTPFRDINRLGINQTGGDA